MVLRRLDATAARISHGALFFTWFTQAAALLPHLDRRHSLGTWVQAERPKARPSSLNCTWRTILQPIDHFGAAPGTFKQRYCLYDRWWKRAIEGGFRAPPGAKGPILFYTGNESPVEVYVNNTGFMWELAPKLGALLVFAEHRYEPMSHPSLCGAGTQRCMAYCTTAQALADYAALIRALQADNGPGNAPVIALGGSYGGMLAGWFRMKYPEVVAGAIAASAPIWMLATTVERRTLDLPSVAISRGLTSDGGASDQCFENLQASWPLLEQVGASKEGLELLSTAVSACRPLEHAEQLTSWAKAVFFLLAEANYPFPSTYITYAVGPGNFPLPPWPMQAACKFVDKDFGLKVTGNTRLVKYTVTLGEIQVDVDWNSATGNGANLSAEQVKRSGVLSLATAVANAAGVWYNVSKDKQCYDMASAPHADLEIADQIAAGVSADSSLDVRHVHEKERCRGLPELATPEGADATCPTCPPCAGCPPCPLSRCNASDNTPCSFTSTIPLTFSWDGICCNDDLNEVSASGLGRDVYWPPSVPMRNYSVESIVGPHELRQGCAARLQPEGLHGVPETSDPYSSWLTAYYGGRNITQHRNIVWSNGALDPWSGQGVYPPDGGPGGPLVQNVTQDGSQIALVLDLGAHHLDLMFADHRDPPCAVKAREVEKQHIHKWCQEVYSAQEAAHSILYV